VRGIEDMQFYTEEVDGKFVGKVEEFPKLRTRPLASRLDAVDGIVSLTAKRIREIHASMSEGKR
jgi:hypothetical protein